MGNLQSILNYTPDVTTNSLNATAGTLLASIGYSFAAFAAQLLVFIVLRDRLSRIYRPKSYLVPERQRVPVPPQGIISWLRPVFKTSDSTLIQRCGLDAYFFLRYLRLLLKIFVPAGLLILPILLPINATGGGGLAQLNILNITNIAAENRGKRYWAHLILAVCFLLWVGYVIYKELRGYIRVRQAYITSPQHRLRASATTVLVSGIPKKWLTIQALDELYDVFPGGIRNIWINRNFDELSTKVQERNKLAKQLESAETNLIKLCQKKHQKALKKGGKSKKDIEQELTPINGSESSQIGGQKESSEGTAAVNGSNQLSENKQRTQNEASQEQLVHDSVNSEANESAGKTEAASATPPEHISGSKLIEGITFWKKKGDSRQNIEYGTPHNEDYDQKKDESAAWRQYIKPKDRETMRLHPFNQGWIPNLPFLGKKVDKIYHIRSELARLNLEIETDQQQPENFPLMNSAFIQFNHQVAAHMACQSVNHHVPLQMAPRLVEISPDDVLWDNMSIKWWERYVRTVIVLAASVALIIFYAVPVSFTAALGNLGNIGASYPSFSWLNNLSASAKSVIQGIGPPLLLSLVLLLVPIIYGFLVKIQGVPTGNARELGVQNWYFVFLFIQVFLVATIASGLLTFFQALATNPNQVANTIGKTLPQAANYFLSYITVQALGNSAAALLQLITLFLWFLFAPIVDSTPRDKWNRQTTLNNIQWGSFFPPFTNFAVIGIIYSVIAPIIIPFVVMVFGIYWIVYRYNVLYVYDFKHDTGGLLFPTAVNQLFVGVYFLELCLTGLFFTAQDLDGTASAIPQGIIMVIVLALSVIFQWLLNATFGPLFRYMPITLEDDAVLRDEEFRRAQDNRFDVEQGSKADDDGEDIQHKLKHEEEAEERADKLSSEKEMADIEARRRNGTAPGTTTAPDSWHNDGSTSWKHDRWKRVEDRARRPLDGVVDLTGKTSGFVNDKLGLKAANGKLGQELRLVNEKVGLKNANEHLNQHIAGANGLDLSSTDPEAQAAVGDALFSGLADELEDLTPDQRDRLVRYSFQHTALRARRPIVWIPQDALGISNDEIVRAKKLSEYLPMSNAGARLTGKGTVVFERSPPDFSNIDLISL